MVANRPESLFPFEWHRKFAFSPPVGMFFNADNFRPLAAAYGSDRINEWRKHFAEEQILKDIKGFFDNHPDLSDEEILASWDDQQIDDDLKPASERIAARLMLIKVKMRALHLCFAYGTEEFAERMRMPETKLPSFD